jgi:hypothetical protein
MKLACAAVALSACMTVAKPAEVIQLPQQPPPGPWAALKDALAGCASDQGLGGEIRVRIDIDPDGGAGVVTANQGGGSFTSCIGAALSHTRFPADHRGRAIEVPFMLAAQ